MEPETRDSQSSGGRQSGNSRSECEWKCGVCQKLFPTSADAKQHARDEHPDSGCQLVCVAATTWAGGNTKGLFDREDTSHHRSQGLVLPLQPRTTPLKFMHDGEGVRLVEGEGYDGASTMHTQIVWGADGPMIERTPLSSKSSGSKAMWLSVGEGGFPLKRQTLLKLGRYLVQVRQIVLDGPSQIPNFSSIKDAGMARVSLRSAEDSSNAPSCRICLDTGDSDEEGPMVSAPCMCKGDVQHVHLGCLRQWLGTRYSVVNRMHPPAEGSAAYSFKPPACDVCKTEFPAVFPGSGRSEEPITLLPDLPLVKPPFVVLSLPRSTDNERPHGERCVFVPGSAGSSLLIGRSSEAGLQLYDVSVSRHHATIHFQGNQFVLENNAARYGTVVMPRGQIALPNDEDPLSIQTGNTVLTLDTEPMYEETTV